MESMIVDFSIVKQKLIKTDEILQMYAENCHKLKKALQVCKELKQKLERTQLENDRCTFSLESVKSKYDTLDAQFKTLFEQKTFLEQKYNQQTIVTQQNIKDLQMEVQYLKELTSFKEQPQQKNSIVVDTKKVEELKDKLLICRDIENQLKMEINNLQTENNKLKKDNSVLQEQISLNTKQQEKINNDFKEEKAKIIQDLSSQNFELQEKIKYYTQLCYDKDNEINILKHNETNNLKNSISDTKPEDKQKMNILQNKLLIKAQVNIDPVQKCSIAIQTNKILELEDLKKSSIAIQTNKILELDTIKENVFLQKDRDLKKCSIAIQTDTILELDTGKENAFLQEDKDLKKMNESVYDIFKEMTYVPELLSPIMSPTPMTDIIDSCNEQDNVHIPNADITENTLLPQIKPKNFENVRKFDINNMSQTKKYRNCKYSQKKQRNLNKKQRTIKKRRIFKCKDNILKALHILKRSKINFTISNESTIPIHCRHNHLECQQTQSNDINMECVYCRSGNCMKIASPSEIDNKLLNFFNVKKETISPAPSRMEFKNEISPQQSPFVCFDNNLQTELTANNILDKLAELVTEKITKNMPKGWQHSVSAVNPEFQSDVETDLQNLFENSTDTTKNSHSSLINLPENKITLNTEKHDLNQTTPPVSLFNIGDTILSENQNVVEKYLTSGPSHTFSAKEVSINNSVQQNIDLINISESSPKSIIKTVNCSSETEDTKPNSESRELEYNATSAKISHNSSELTGVNGVPKTPCKTIINTTEVLPFRDDKQELDRIINKNVERLDNIDFEKCSPRSQNDKPKLDNNNCIEINSSTLKQIEPELDHINSIENNHNILSCPASPASDLNLTIQAAAFFNISDTALSNHQNDLENYLTSIASHTSPATEVSTNKSPQQDINLINISESSSKITNKDELTTNNEKSIELDYNTFVSNVTKCNNSELTRVDDLSQSQIHSYNNDKSVLDADYCIEKDDGTVNQNVQKLGDNDGNEICSLINQIDNSPTAASPTPVVMVSTMPTPIYVSNCPESLVSRDARCLTSVSNCPASPIPSCLISTSSCLDSPITSCLISAVSRSPASTPNCLVSPIPNCPISPIPNCPISPIPSCPISPIPSCLVSPIPNCPVSPIPSCLISPIHSCPASPTPSSPASPTTSCPASPILNCPASPIPNCPASPIPNCPVSPIPSCPASPTPSCPASPTPSCPASPTFSCPGSPVPNNSFILELHKYPRIIPLDRVEDITNENSPKDVNSPKFTNSSFSTCLLETEIVDKDVNKIDKSTTQLVTDLTIDSSLCKYTSDSLNPFPKPENEKLEVCCGKTDNLKACKQKRNSCRINSDLKLRNEKQLTGRMLTRKMAAELNKTTDCTNSSRSTEIVNNSCLNEDSNKETTKKRKRLISENKETKILSNSVCDKSEIKYPDQLGTIKKGRGRPRKYPKIDGKVLETCKNENIPNVVEEVNLNEINTDEQNKNINNTDMFNCAKSETPELSDGSKNHAKLNSEMHNLADGSSNVTKPEKHDISCDISNIVNSEMSNLAADFSNVTKPETGDLSHDPSNVAKSKKPELMDDTGIVENSEIHNLTNDSSNVTKPETGDVSHDPSNDAKSEKHQSIDDTRNVVSSEMQNPADDSSNVTKSKTGDLSHNTSNVANSEKHECMDDTGIVENSEIHNLADDSSNVTTPETGDLSHDPSNVAKSEKHQSMDDASNVVSSEMHNLADDSSNVTTPKTGDLSHDTSNVAKSEKHECMDDTGIVENSEIHNLADYSSNVTKPETGDLSHDPSDVAKSEKHQSMDDTSNVSSEMYNLADDSSNVTTPETGDLSHDPSNVAKSEKHQSMDDASNVVSSEMHNLADDSSNVTTPETGDLSHDPSNVAKSEKHQSMDDASNVVSSEMHNLADDSSNVTTPETGDLSHDPSNVAKSEKHQSMDDASNVVSSEMHNLADDSSNVTTPETGDLSHDPSNVAKSEKHQSMDDASNVISSEMHNSADDSSNVAKSEKHQSMDDASNVVSSEMHNLADDSSNVTTPETGDLSHDLSNVAKSEKHQSMDDASNVISSEMHNSADDSSNVAKSEKRQSMDDASNVVSSEMHNLADDSSNVTTPETGDLSHDPSNVAKSEKHELMDDTSDITKSETHQLMDETSNVVNSEMHIPADGFRKDTKPQTGDISDATSNVAKSETHQLIADTTYAKKIEKPTIKRKPVKKSKLHMQVMRQMKEKQKMYQQATTSSSKNHTINCDVRIKDKAGKSPPKSSNNANVEPNKTGNKINIVQDILIRPNCNKPIDLLNVNDTGSQISNKRKLKSVMSCTKKRAAVKEENNCDILSKIMSEMDTVKPKEAVKDSVIKDIPTGINDKQWRSKILDIAEVTHNTNVDMKHIYSSQPDKTLRDGILKANSRLPIKISLLLKKLVAIPNEDDIPEGILLEFKRLTVKQVVDITIYQVSRDIHDKPSDKYYPAPLMTRTQRIFLCLLVRLEREKKFETIIDVVLTNLQEFLMRIGCGIRPAISLTRLFLSLCRLHADIHRMRTFCCEAFYYVGDLAVPILFTVLTSWSEVFPFEAVSNNFPLAKVIVQLVHLKTCGRPGFNLLPLKGLLSQYYGYPKERWNCDQIFEEVYQSFLANPSVPTDYAIRLFCKNKDTKFVYKKLNEFFKPLIYKIPAENVNFKATTIILMGKICKVFKPSNAHDKKCLVELLRWFEGLLEDNPAEILQRSVHYAIEHLPKKGKKKKKIGKCRK